MSELLFGYGNAEIARRRGVALQTVANQLHQLFRALGVSSRGELAAVVLAARGGPLSTRLAAARSLRPGWRLEDRWLPPSWSPRQQPAEGIDEFALSVRELLGCWRALTLTDPRAAA